MCGTRILIAEGEAITAWDLLGQLNQLGYERVGRAGAGDEALSLAGELRPELALVDLHLAGRLDGIATARLLYEQFSVPVIFLAAQLEESLLAQAQDAQPYGFITQPPKAIELRVAIKQAIQRRQVECQLCHARDEQAAILRAAMDGFCLVDEQGRLLEVNEAYSRMCGFNREELCQMSIADLSASDSPGEIVTQMRYIKESGGARFERQHRHKDGHQFEVELSVKHLPASGGRFFCFVRDVTQSKRLEKTLRNERALFRTIIDHIPFPVYAKDAQARKIVANLADVRNIGVASEADLLNKDDSQLFPKEQAEKHYAVDQCVLQTGQPVTGVEDAFIQASGETKWLLSSKIPFFDAQGKVAGLVGIGQDITDRKQAEREIKRLSQWLLRTQRISRVGGWAVNMRTGETWVSPEARRIYGVGDEEPMPLPKVQSFPLPCHRPLLDQALRDLIERGKPYDVEFQIARSSDGAIVDIHSLAEYEAAETTVLGVIEDITARKHAEESRRASEAKYRRIFENIQDVYYETTIDGLILEVSPSIEKLTRGQYHREDLIGQKITSLYAHPEDREVFLRALFKQGWVTDSEVAFRNRDNTVIPCALSAQLQRNEQGKPETVIGSLRDITERKQLEAALKTRLVALTRPLNQSENIAFEELFELADIQRIQDEFAAAMGVASIITRPDGEPITKPSNFCQLCEGIIRRTEAGRLNCRRSDAQLGRHHPDGPIIQRCLSCGLWDAGTSITVGGRHLANWLIGQVRDGSYSDEELQACARAIGADEEAMIQAWQQVPVMPLARFQQAAQALFTVANQLSSSAYQNLQQARFIAERMQAEEALRKSEDQYRTLFREMLGGFALHEIICDAQGRPVDYRFLKVNPAFERLTGLNGSDLIGKTVTEVLPGIEPHWINIYGKVALTGEPMYFVHSSQDLGKSFEVAAFRPAINQFACIFVDITQRQRAEEALRESSQFNQQIIHDVREGVIVYDCHLRYQVWNPTMEQITGMSASEVLGRLPWEVFPFLRETGMMESLEKVLRGELANNLEFPYHVPLTGRSGWASDTRSALRNSKGEIIGVIATVQDITKRKQAEAEKARLEAQFHQAQKMESIGQLAGGVAHDFSNILTSVMMHLSLLKDNPGLDTDTREALRELLADAKRGAGLIRQLLVFSRRTALEAKVLNLNDVVANLLKMLGRLIGEHISLQFNPQENLPAMEADPGMVEQVLMNLVVNARDAMPKGGLITIGTEAAQIDAGQVKGFPDVQPGLFVCLLVADTGCGMDEATRARIFEPFFTTKEPGCGTGLGLATVYGIVTQHQGWIEVESCLAQGTTFKIYFPTTNKAKAAAPTAEPAERSQGHETILIVEDEANLRQALAISLRHLGYHVLEASNGQEAVKLWGKHAAQIDLLLSDMVIPGSLAGFDLAEIFTQEKPGLKVILSSGYNDEIARRGKLAARNLRHLQKPYETGVLSKAIRDCLDHA